MNWLEFRHQLVHLLFSVTCRLSDHEIRKAVEEKADVIKAYVVKDGALVPFEMTLGALTDDERENYI